MVRGVRGHDRLWDVAALGGLALAALALCWPLGLTNRILAGIDAFTYFTPYWAYRMEAFRAGVVPLWNPYLFSGAPFLANIQAAVLYPLHWPLSWLGPEQALVWSALLHVWMASAFTYLFARRTLRVRHLAAFGAGQIFGLGGFTLARIENINQLNALAWLPALLWLYDECLRQPSHAFSGRRAAPFIGLSVAIALQLLAGHTQTTFINMVGLGLWALLSLGRPLRPARLWPLLSVVIAMGLAAAQLLPTLELNGLGLRTGGLPYRQAVSFSLRPQLLLQSLLPPFGRGLAEAFGSEGYAEFVGYVGVSGLLLAGFGVLTGWRSAVTRWGGWLRPVALAAAGLLLALGAYNPLTYVLWRFVPGFDLFRAPARWLALFALGCAQLAALGIDGLAKADPVRPAARPRGRLTWAMIALVVLAGVALLVLQVWPSAPTVAGWVAAAAATVVLIGWSQRAAQKKSPAAEGPAAWLQFAPALLVALLLGELLLASRGLPYTLATAPMATSLRTAPAALLGATEAQPPAGRDRFLSLSDIRFDPGDLAELRDLQSDRLPPEAVERMVRATKQVEVLSPNLSLFYRLPAVDGYDGGLLPLQRYVLLQELFLSSGEMTPDGRLREQLGATPDRRLLDLTGVRFVVTDKQRDLWVDDVYYDLEQPAIAAGGTRIDLDLAGYPSFIADAVGLVVQATSGTEPHPVLLEVTPFEGAQVSVAFEAPPTPANGPVAPVIVPLPAAVRPAQIVLHNNGDGELMLLGMSLIDRSTGAHASVTVSPHGDFRRIHSGDVKVYERLGAPGRAWIVHGVLPVAGAEAAQAAVAEASFDPRAVAVVEADLPAAGPAPAGPGEQVTIGDYEAARLTLRATLTEPGLLVVADAWYPGWRGQVDGEDVEIVPANLLYRAVALGPGVHEVAMSYEPRSWRAGVWISLATAAVLLIALLAALRDRFIRL